MIREVCSLAGLLGVAAVGAVTAQEPRPPEIAVTATGTVDLSPDYAIVQVGVITRDAQAGRAGEQNARLMAAVRAALRQLLRVGDDSLPTVEYSVATDHDRDRRPAGYAARSLIEAHVRDLTQVGSAIDAALGAGATSVASIQFESTKRAAARLEALARAMQTARREAESMAHAAGGSLGPLIEATSIGPVYAMSARRSAAMAMAAAETPISAPELAVEATVTARWRFVPR